MPRIVFDANVLGAEKVVDAPDGGELVDLCDLHFAPIPFSCRSASCGTCTIDVIEGADLLEPPNPAERELLELLNLRSRSRLACQTRVKCGRGTVRVRPHGL